MTTIDRTKWYEQPTLWDLLTQRGGEVHLWHNEEGDLIHGEIEVGEHGIRLHGWGACDETFENVLDILSPKPSPCGEGDGRGKESVA